MQQVAIIFEFVDLLQSHPALNAASNGGRFVSREINRCRSSQQTKDMLHIAAVANLRGLRVEAVSNIGMMTNASDFLCNAGTESE